MKYLNRNNILIISGISIGTLGGFLYYYFIGCQSGGCAITSSPWLSMLWGAAVGYLVSDLFRKKKPDASQDEASR
jgi:hypothetical protein